MTLIYNAIENPITEVKTYLIDESIRPITISLDDEDYIEVYDEINSYKSTFHKDEYNVYLNLLEQAYDYEEYDEDGDEYYNPDEIDLNEHEILWTFDIKFEKYYGGNWIIRDRIPQIKKAIDKFKNEYIQPLTIDDIKDLLQDRDNLSINKLLNMKKCIEKYKGE